MSLLDRVPITACLDPSLTILLLTVQHTVEKKPARISASAKVYIYTKSWKLNLCLSCETLDARIRFWAPASLQLLSALQHGVGIGYIMKDPVSPNYSRNLPTAFSYHRCRVGQETFCWSYHSNLDLWSAALCRPWSSSYQIRQQVEKDHAPICPIWLYLNFSLWYTSIDDAVGLHASLLVREQIWQKWTMKASILPSILPWNFVLTLKYWTMQLGEGHIP